MHTLAEESGVHLSFGGGSVGMTNFPGGEVSWAETGPGFVEGVRTRVCATGVMEWRRLTELPLLDMDLGTLLEPGAPGGTADSV